MESRDKKRSLTRWALVLYDIAIIAFVAALLFYFYGSSDRPEADVIILQVCIAAFCIITCRFVFKTYSAIWRYGGIQNYMKLMISDLVALCFYYALGGFILPIPRINFIDMLALVLLSLLLSLAIRMTYRYAYKCGNKDTFFGKFLLWLLKYFGGVNVTRFHEVKKIKVAIMGAGSLGSNLYDEIIMDSRSPYEVRCFIDTDKSKVGRYISGTIILDENNLSPERLVTDYNIQEVFFAIHNYPQEKMRAFYEKFSKAGIKVKNYDVPHMESGVDKPQLREFEIEELLFRKPIVINDEKTFCYYKGKTILITGGGGSIGSELCRQLGRMNPERIVILDVYENGAYDLQQELKIKYGNKLKVDVEIASITNYSALERVFSTYRPDIVINAAAHKHVPLMEHNVIEAIENNIFGCKNVIMLSEKYKAERFMMVSTDKAVNPTNVMGATKRMCEMMVQSASTKGNVKYSATRFGNVLGSAGSVIPLFKRQIASGGPVTITDRRIIRYFMTIPEASQLVLQSGAMAKNGELFVLDMGKPVKILELAENMISIMGARNIEIIETGLRPGEKLYEELLVKTEELDKTENSLIFIERDTPLSSIEIEEKLDILKKAVESKSDDEAREALRKVVPTFVNPEEVNSKV